MDDFSQEEMLVVDEENGTYRLTVFDVDPFSEALSVMEIIEGTLLQAIADEMEDRSLTNIPILVRHSDKTNNPGEVLSADGAKVLEAPGATPLDTLKRALEIKCNPPPAFEDVLPRTSATDLVNTLIEGQLRAGNEYHFQNGESARIIHNRNTPGISIELRNKREKLEWNFDINDGYYKRVS